MPWSTFLPAALLVSLVPGANQLLSLRNAMRQGTLDATVALAGRFTAFAILVVVAAAGLGAVLAASAVAFETIRWVGVAYLAWLGVTTLLRSRDAATVPAAPRRTRRRLVAGEFVVALTNPKALLLFVAFVPQFLPARETGPVALAALGFAYIGVEACSALAYTVLGGRLHGREITQRAHGWFDRVTGTAFLGLAGALAVEQRP